MTAVHHRYADVGGLWPSYPEAGPADAPVVVLLHGFPTSSFMFRNLIHRLDGGHFLVESRLDTVEATVRPFLETSVA